MTKRKRTQQAPPPPPGNIIDMPPGVSVSQRDDTEEADMVDVTESQSQTVTVGTMTVEVPYMELPAGYCRRRFDVSYTTEQALKWRAMFHGLEQQEARLNNGKVVACVMDAMRWVAENVEVGKTTG